MTDSIHKQALDQMLTDQWKRDHPNMPEAYRPKKKASKSDSVQLQTDIKKFIKQSGQFCEEVQTKGTYREGVGFTAGGYTRGSADLHIMLWAKQGDLIVWKCEIKVGKDRQRPDQQKYQASIEAFNRRGVRNCKGIVHYSIVKTYDDFIKQYTDLMSF